jgi:heptose I phosphotransferase
VGKGLRGWNPARRESFVVMKGLAERAVANEVLKEHPPAALKRMILRKVATSVRRMHDSGMNHRDCYLCHFHLPKRDWSEWDGTDDFESPLIDLHRAQIREAVPRRWLVKDLGALLFSALECGPTDRDLLLLWKTYLGQRWRETVRKDEGFWRRVWARALKFYRRDHGVDPVVPGVFAKLVR